MDARANFILLEHGPRTEVHEHGPGTETHSAGTGVGALELKWLHNCLVRKKVENTGEAPAAEVLLAFPPARFDHIALVKAAAAVGKKKEKSYLPLEGTELRYGPYEDRHPYSYSPVIIHLENNNAFAVVEELERENESELLIEPRYPSFGVWKAIFVIGYGVPLQDFLFESDDGSRYLNYTFG
ncbi:unnamed protein product [Fraxinus pennsylvanica]|uniref:Dolichyl-diphosphooligosaccharide--protein glycosyltransferase subunit 1 n=1 Tax=Fraxinus pennsylvanica TaxID=56036 RepID=A0AAD1ZDB5_9LAMI|nr:unnamed protein product [Fraxinus pennsylvanica]